MLTLAPRLCALTLLGLLLTAALPPALAGQLTIIADGGTIAQDQSQPPTARYEFGERKPDDSPLTHTFLLHNGGKTPITVTQLEASCGCTTAVLGDDQALPDTVQPGANVAVEVSVSPQRLAPGPVHKTVWVYTADHPDQPAALLEIDGALQSDAALSPQNALRPGHPRPSVLPQTGHLAPPFTRADANGKPFTLTAARGRPLALFFFCGCPWCADVAKVWGRVQRGASLPASTQTIIVFAGDKAAASAFAAKNGLDLGQTLLLPDPDSHLTETVYKANSCPRVFVVDPQGVIVYTNDHPDDLPRLAPAKTIVTRTFAALAQTDNFETK